MQKGHPTGTNSNRFAHLENRESFSGAFQFSGANQHSAFSMPVSSNYNPEIRHINRN